MDKQDSKKKDKKHSKTRQAKDEQIGGQMGVDLGNKKAKKNQFDVDEKMKRAQVKLDGVDNA